jgi:hypothetical protein
MIGTIMENPFLTVMVLILAGVFIGLVILFFVFHLPYVRRMQKKLTRARSKEGEQKPPKKSEPEPLVHNFYNDKIQITDNLNGGFRLSLTKRGEESLHKYATVNEAICALQSFLDIEPWVTESNTVRGPMVSIYKAYAFYWHIKNYVDRIEDLVADERVENEEKDFEDDEETTNKENSDVGTTGIEGSDS